MGSWGRCARLLVAALLILGFAGGAVDAGTTGTEPAVYGPVPFGPGEQCRFAVKFGVIRAGSATLSVEPAPAGEAPHVFRLVSTAESSRFFSTFFKVEDRVESIWSSADRLPMRFQKDINEGQYHKDISVIFDQEAGRAIYAGGDTIEMAPGSQDVLSAFYYVRTLDLKPGTEVAVPNHANKKNYPLEVKVLRRETVKVKAGRFDCVVVEPLLKSAGLFKQEGRLTIWLSDDSRRLPVLMKSKVAVGSIIAELESYRSGRPVPVNRGTQPQANQRRGR